MAPTPIQYPIINGDRHSFASVELKFISDTFNFIIMGIKSINYNRERSRGWAKGNHPDPLGKTRGTNEYEADIEMYLAEWNFLMMSLGDGYGDIRFTTLVTYTENGFDTVQDSLLGCTLDSGDASNETGDDPTVRKSNLNPVKILYNGKDDLKVPLRGVGT